MTKSSNPLPEKCCARCGFLYGLARNAAMSADAVFDPDLIRLPSYPPQRGQKMGHDPTVIASRPYTIQRGDWESQSRPLTMEQDTQYVVKHRVVMHTWRQTSALHCYLNRIDPLPSIGPIREPAGSVPWHQIETAIHSDRESCDGFFPYHPGHTPAQHIDLRIEEQRIQRAEAHEKMLVEWSAELERRLAESAQAQEERWRTFQISWEDAWRKKEQRLAIFFGVLGLFYTMCGWVVGFLIARFFPGN